MSHFVIPAVALCNYNNCRTLHNKLSHFVINNKLPHLDSNKLLSHFVITTCRTL